VDETGSTLFLVTQPAGRAICLATAIDSATGHIRWQRQLGLLCQDEPIVLGKELLALDQGGGLFRFEPEKHPNLPDLPWQIVGNNNIGPAIEGAAPSSTFLIPSPDGQSVWEVALVSPGSQLQVRRYRAGTLDKYKLDLNLKPQTTLVGPPAVRGDNLLLPLTDKNLLWLQLPLGDTGRANVPPWRARTAPAGARGYVVWLKDNEFVTTNGLQGLTHWRGLADGTCQAVPADRDAENPTIQLASNIVAPPVVMPGEREGDAGRLVVADAKGTVYLFGADNLERCLRKWDLRGHVTAGPFVRGRQVGCVLNGRRLIWIDPDREQPLWEYDGPAEGIVGEPNIVGDMVLVADAAGRFVGLDPQTGRLLGPGYTSAANSPPVCAPVAFGPDRAFAPLSDGTILLLSLPRLRNPFKGVFLVW
jgi:hypothetical protein